MVAAFCILHINENYELNAIEKNYIPQIASKAIQYTTFFHITDAANIDPVLYFIIRLEDTPKFHQVKNNFERAPVLIVNQDLGIRGNPGLMN